MFHCEIHSKLTIKHYIVALLFLLILIYISYVLDLGGVIKKGILCCCSLHIRFFHDM